MGGSGSGRWGWHSKAITVEECLSFSAGDLKAALARGSGQDGNVWWTSRGEETGRISYRTEQRGGALVLRLRYMRTGQGGGEQKDINYTVGLTTTRPNFGGVRRWFICPLVVNGKACGRRAGKLYLPPGGRFFGCRTCHGLTYRSAQEHDARTDFYRKNPGALQAALVGGRMNSAALRTTLSSWER